MNWHISCHLSWIAILASGRFCQAPLWALNLVAAHRYETQGKCSLPDSCRHVAAMLADVWPHNEVRR